MGFKVLFQSAIPQFGIFLQFHNLGFFWNSRSGAGSREKPGIPDLFLQLHSSSLQSQEILTLLSQKSQFQCDVELPFPLPL